MTKSRSDLIKDMQNIADEIKNKREEVEILLNIIQELYTKYFSIAEEIKNN